jgi:hypothetical protein
LTAQTFTLNPLTSAGAQQNGFHLYNFSAFAQYSTVDQSWINLVDTLSGSPGTPLPSYTSVSGFSASVGLHVGGVEGARSNFSLIYSPTFSYTTYGQSSSQLAHTLAFSWSRKLAPQWQLSVSASGVEGAFDQFLFSPTNAQNVASLVGTAQELAGQFLTGQSSNPSIAAGTGAAATVTPQVQLFYGDRILSAMTQVGLSYSHSPRMTFGITASGSRMQHLKTSSSLGSDYFFIPENTNVGFGGSFSYLLSERTSLMGSVQYGRGMSSIYNEQSGAALMGLGRKLTQNWFTDFAAGGGYILPIQSTASTSANGRGKQWEANGKIGYRSRTNTLVASADRSLSDLYGAGAAATLALSGGWNWRKPGRKWALQAGAEEDLLSGQAVAADLATHGFRANAGIYLNLSRRSSVVVQYSYDTFWGTFPSVSSATSSTTGQPVRFAQNSIRLNFGFGAGGGSGSPGSPGAPTAAP